MEEKDVSELNPLILFSGDFVGPSLMSTFTKGKHMMEILEIIGVDAGTVGNHEFDFGTENFRHLTNDCCLFDGVSAKSVWISTNIDAPNGEPIAGCVRYKLLEANGVKVGILGLSEDWLSDAGLSSYTSNPNVYGLWNNEAERGLKYAQILREQGADIVLALVHNLVANTVALAGALRPHVDFVLGGHEHLAAPDDPEDAGWIISGSDFEEFSLLTFALPPPHRTPAPPSIRRVAVRPDQPISASPRVARLRRLVAAYEADLDARLGEPIGRVPLPLDCRKFKLRTQETAAGAFFADAFLAALRGRGAEACLIVAGVISGHTEWPPGEWTTRHIAACFPWEGALALLRVPGRDLVAALEHGVALLPRRYGRFPQARRRRRILRAPFSAPSVAASGNRGVAGSSPSRERPAPAPPIRSPGGPAVSLSFCGRFCPERALAHAHTRPRARP